MRRALGFGGRLVVRLFKLVVVVVILVLLALLVHGLDHDAARLAADQRHDRARRASTGPSRSVRDRAGIIQITADDPPRPVHGPGLRPRPGADVADGDLAPHRRGPPVRALRQEPGRPRPVHPDARLARRRAARPRRDVARDDGDPAGLRRRRERLDHRARGPPVDAVRRRRPAVRHAAASAASRSSRGRRSTPRRGRRSRPGRSAGTSTRRSSGSSPTPGSAIRPARTSSSRRTTPRRR